MSQYGVNHKVERYPLAFHQIMNMLFFLLIQTIQKSGECQEMKKKQHDMVFLMMKVFLLGQTFGVQGPIPGEKTDRSFFIKFLLTQMGTFLSLNINGIGSKIFGKQANYMTINMLFSLLIQRVLKGCGPLDGSVQSEKSQHCFRQKIFQVNGKYTGNIGPTKKVHFQVRGGIHPGILQVKVGQRC